MTAPQAADDFTELVDADIPRVDLVDKAANGTRFLIAKAAAGGLLQPLVPADMVRDLIAKAEEAPVTDSPADDVTKDAPPVEVDEIMPSAPGGSTAESLPGSPDWEQLDGDTAMSAVAVLGRVKSVLCWLADREAQEAVTGDGDAEADGNSWDLDAMSCSVDYIISCLAGFAAGEHLEAGMADELEAVGKAVAAVAAPLAALEGFVPVAKAGRTLSAANETKIRTAVDSLTEVLNSLPAAPAADVTKTEETTVPEPTASVVEEKHPAFLQGAVTLAKAMEDAPRLTAARTFAALADGGSTVDLHKAKGDPQLAVFDENGKLIGTVDPADLTAIASSASEAADAGADVSADDSGDTAPAADAAAPAEPADDAARVVPGTDTVQAPPQQPDDTQTPAVAKTADPAALEEDRVAALAKQVESLAADNEVLKEQVRKFGMQPDDRRSPVLNGATGAGTVTRDATQVDPLADVKKAIDDEPDPIRKAELAKAAFFAGVRARFEA